MPSAPVDTGSGSSGETPLASLLLVSDLDGTLIAPGPVREEDTSALRRFRRLVHERSEVVLAYATGRDFHRTMEGIRSCDLPLPDAILSDVGTRILHRIKETESYEQDETYAARLKASFGSADRTSFEDLIGSIPGVELQEESKQGTFKVSFYVDPRIEDEAVLREVDNVLGDRRERIKVVFSRDPASLGLLDLLPRAASKASATRHLSDRLGVPDRRVFYFGDSGNDTDALLAGFNAVLVGNAPESLRLFLKDRASRGGIADRLYFARSLYAAGVVEGCRHFDVL